MPSIDELEQQIRDFINNPRKRHALLQDIAAWNLLCSCLDTVGDTELAISAYEQSSNPPTVGAAYLLVYGVLQALFIQQDAVENLCQALVITYVPHKLLTEIRDIRNDSTGHPTKRGRGKGRAYNFIGRSSLKKDGFDLMTTYPDKSPPLFRHVSTESLIEGQREVMQKALTEVLGKLKEEEANHRAKYRDQKLEDTFPPTLGYYFAKIGNAIDGSAPGGFGTMHVGLVSKVIEYPVQELTTYFDDAARSSLTADGAHIFAFFVDKHLEELKSMAREIDEDYKSEP